ncbi:MAG TPA: FAD-binding oxidoreductase [Blastocatellia bacterium]|jgi:D-lactate dehydrogenase (cytochrome)|nr:FAD-binding oxidoreductase [Blastocatellia bacterium]HAF25610.1 FAD-binding oxidoreductase [Blastocatellia bacterium]
MLIKTDPDEIQAFLSDSSYMQAGHADRVVFPETAEEVAEILRDATRNKTPVTVSGAGTGTVGGRIPFAGIVLATDKLNQIRSIVHEEEGGSAVAEAGLMLSDLQRFVESEGLLYPPDPTERSCFLGGTVATNASGARTFKYGPTRNYVRRLKIALPTGEIIDLRRGDLRADATGRIEIPLPSGRLLEAQLPTYHMPQTRKHASGYYVGREMDVLDLFIGSEGTLGVITEVEVGLLPKPEGLLSGVVFFSSDDTLLAFVREARAQSLANRLSDQTQAGRLGSLMEKALEVSARRANQTTEAEERSNHAIDARALEYFDNESLKFLRQNYATIPAEARGAIFFEQETTPETEDSIMKAWLVLLERNTALVDSSWFATNEQEQAKLREFRHALPVLMNEWFARHRQRKVSTDMAVPDETFAEMLHFYQGTLRTSELRYTIFGHIGDNHVHVNILPRNDEEAAQAREIYLRFVKRAVELGGTISAEHGIGKLKREYLRELYSEQHLREMAALKRAFDPAGILGRGNMFDEEYL